MPCCPGTTYSYQIALELAEGVCVEQSSAFGLPSSLGQVLHVSTPLAHDSIFLPLFCILFLLDVERELATRLINISIHSYVSFWVSSS
jgi:hypothetical protein